MWLGYSPTMGYVATTGAKDLSFWTNTVEKMRILSGGNVGINVTDPDAKLEILSTTTQLKLSYDGTFSTTFTVNSAGDLTVNPGGTKVTIDSGLTMLGDITMPDSSFIGKFGASIIDFDQADNAINFMPSGHFVGIGVKADPAGANLQVAGTSSFANVATFNFGILFGAGEGLPYGHMYTNATIAVAITDTTPVEVGNTFTTGVMHICTFGASHYIVAVQAGVYMVTWSMSIAQNSPSAALECEAGIMIGGVANVLGRDHTTIPNGTAKEAVGSTTLITLTASQQVSLYIVNETNATDIDVEHANLTVVYVGG
jgi:hypothetical protein